MPCMCGDYQCPSCGPAQGNWRCPLCGAWADDLCKHMNEEGTSIKPEFEAEAKHIFEDEAEAENRMCAELDEDWELDEI